MFIGHFGVGFAAKAAARKSSLGTLFFGAQFLDLLWPTLLLLGLERVRIVPGRSPRPPLVFESYPISHSLLAVIAWGALAAAVYLWLRRYRRGAIVLGLLVISHWVLDLIVHEPDLPLVPGVSTKVGLGLWGSLPGTLVVELSVFLAGAWWYARSTRSRDGVGKWGFRGLVAFLLLIHAANVFGAPPPSVNAIAWVGQSQWLVVLLGFWVDRHRYAVPRS